MTYETRVLNENPETCAVCNGPLSNSDIVALVTPPEGPGHFIIHGDPAFVSCSINCKLGNVVDYQIYAGDHNWAKQPLLEVLRRNLRTLQEARRTVNDPPSRKSDWELSSCRFLEHWHKRYKVPRANTQKFHSIRDRFILDTEIKEEYIIQNFGQEFSDQECFFMARALATLDLFKDDGEEIYRVAEKFGADLHKTRMTFSGSFLPILNRMICVEFPRSLYFPTSKADDKFLIEDVRCAYVTTWETPEGDVGFLAQLPKMCGNVSTSRVMVIDKVYAKGRELRLQMDYDEEDPLNEGFRGFEAYLPFILKSLVYINSGDPDLRKYRAPKPSSQKAKRLKKFFKDHENESLYDMTLIGYDWNKPRVFSLSETPVSGHFRWQHYGPQNCKIKLIWIDESVRRYPTEPPVPTNPHESSNLMVEKFCKKEEGSDWGRPRS